MGKKKYIIELEDKPFHKEDGDFLYRVKGFNSLVFDLTGISKLTPYTEPDLEQVRKEAYADGYKEGCDAKFRRLTGSEYQRGLNDAWDAARTLWNTPNRKEIFGHTTFNTVLTTLTAQETIEKIRQYEKEKEEIKVGDEVKNIECGWTAIVTKSEEGHLTLMCDSGAIANGYDAKYFAKTGRHFHEIAVVLQKMREG